MAVVATLAVAGAVTGLAVLPQASASDDLGKTVAAKPWRASSAKQKLPPNAKRSTRASMPAPGQRAKPFSDRTKQPRVVGGTAVDAVDYPWIVGIRTWFDVPNNNNGFDTFVATCTGTIISTTKVLTAGHCDTDFNNGTTFVYAGRNMLDDNSAGFVARVQSTWTDPTFNLAALNQGQNVPPIDDVSVLTLTKPLGAPYHAIDLAAAGPPVNYDEQGAYVIGYGVTATGNSDAGTLRKANVPIHNSANCASNLGSDSGYDNSRMLCAGILGSPGVDACHGDSGGPIIVNNGTSDVEVGITDWGFDPCAVQFYGVYERISTYRTLIDADVAWPGVINSDWSGDGHSDLVGRDSVGEIVDFSGSGFVDDGFSGINTAPPIIGTGWGGFTKLFRVMNWDGDGTPAIMARTSSGLLLKYKGDGGGGFLPNQPTQVGSSWNGFTDIMVTNNWTGDGHPNILGRTARGDLMLYTSNGAGGWENNGIGIKIGTGWNGFNTVLTPGDWRGNGHQALIGRSPNGVLFLYESDGHGSWLNNGVGILIGTGWNGFRVFMSPGDFGGDNKVDLIGLSPAGNMNLYSTDGHGNWLNNGQGRLLSVPWDWNDINTLF